MDTNNEFEHAEVKATDLVSWPRIAAVSAMVSFSLPTFVTGLEIYQALTIHDALWALIIGSLILMAIGGAMGTIGARSRLSSYFLVRIAFGNAGAGIVNLAFAISLIGWFGFNIDLFSNAVVQLLGAEFNIIIPEWPIDIFAGICMLVTTLYGFRAINILASVMVPVLAIVTGMMFWGAIEEMTFNQFLSFEKSAALTLGEGVSAIVGVIIIGAIILPDITRFSKEKRGGVYTVFWSYMVVELFVLFVSVFAATAMQETKILSLMLDLNLGFSAFFIVIAGSWVLNSLNLYSTTLSVEATFPKWDKRAVIIILGAIGILAAFMNILDIFIEFLSFLSDIFVPVAGVIIIDALFIRPEGYNIKTLENHFRFSIPAFFAWLVGATFAVFNGTFFTANVSGITVIDAIVLTGIIYTILMKCAKFLPFRTMIK
ncbi:purine-cytosine permease family protein [Thalassotalea crassostreae]|uniref:purine-cytosine permease family protein n=1 Tax=Thalassotalea crassostreae TaxID=1763536 RepID=UPI000838BB60|nr:cytosine permease [Thalassotalea crassostreae]